MVNITKRLLITLLAVLLAVFFIDVVDASGGVFIIEPAQEITENVMLTPSSEVTGNVSVSNGLIDFYITNPSGNLVLCINQTEFNTFNFIADEYGNYTMHLRNTNQRENVTVKLCYCINLFVAVQSTLSFNSNVSTPTTIITINWTAIFQLIMSFFAGLGSLGGFLLKLKKYLERKKREREWKKKYEKSRTPVVAKRFLALVLSYFKL